MFIFAMIMLMALESFQVYLHWTVWLGGSDDHAAKVVLI